MVLWRKFEPRRDEVTVEWRKLHNEQLNYLFPSPSIVRVIKSRRMRWAGHLAGMGDRTCGYRVLAGKPEGKSPGGSPGGGWDNIKMILRKGDRGLWIGSIWLMIGTGGRHL
jgi:hypothetical protein